MALKILLKIRLYPFGRELGYSLRSPYGSSVDPSGENNKVTAYA
jgi:hypothetical protein